LIHPLEKALEGDVTWEECLEAPQLASIVAAFQLILVKGPNS
jgi:hypothetical protein